MKRPHRTAVPSEDVAELEPEMLVRMGCIETLNQNNLTETDKYYTEDATDYSSTDEPGTLADLKDDGVDFLRAFRTSKANSPNTRRR